MKKFEIMDDNRNSMILLQFQATSHLKGLKLSFFMFLYFMCIDLAVWILDSL